MDGDRDRAAARNNNVRWRRLRQATGERERREGANRGNAREWKGPASKLRASLDWRYLQKLPPVKHTHRPPFYHHVARTRYCEDIAV